MELFWREWVVTWVRKAVLVAKPNRRCQAGHSGNGNKASSRIPGPAKGSARIGFRRSGQ